MVVQLLNETHKTPDNSVNAFLPRIPDNRRRSPPALSDKLFLTSPTRLVSTGLPVLLKKYPLNPFFRLSGVFSVPSRCKRLGSWSCESVACDSGSCDSVLRCLVLICLAVGESRSVASSILPQLSGILPPSADRELCEGVVESIFLSIAIAAIE